MRPNSVPRHKHRFETYIIDKDERSKCKIVECRVKGCKVRFVREVFFPKVSQKGRVVIG